MHDVLVSRHFELHRNRHSDSKYLPLFPANRPTLRCLHKTGRSLSVVVGVGRFCKMQWSRSWSFCLRKRNHRHPLSCAARKIITAHHTDESSIGRDYPSKYETTLTMRHKCQKHRAVSRCGRYWHPLRRKRVGCISIIFVFNHIKILF
jgi:hypothetical protein